MRILHIICQKPHSTGSGVYMTELIDAFKHLSHDNAAIYGIENDEPNFFDNLTVKDFPVRFSSDKLPFNVFGMSDEMPYDSSQFKNMNDDIFNKYKNAFLDRINEAINNFKPDLIISNHLYILTSIVRENVKNIPIVGICHNTDIRQYIKTHFKNDYIKENINKLDVIFTPTEYLKKEVNEVYDVDLNKIHILGTGYNDKIFYNKNFTKDRNKIRFIYVGKIAKAKGVLDLVKAFKLLENEIDTSNISLSLAGKSGNKHEYDQIIDIFNSLKIEKFNYGMIPKTELSDLYNKQNVFIISSYTEAVPLTSIEALSCGLKVIISDIPGIKEYLDKHVENAYIDYINLPKLTNVDEITDEESDKFAIRIKNAIIKAIDDKDNTYNPIIKDVSWIHMAEKILNTIN